jgi:hypothetical protein
MIKVLLAFMAGVVVASLAHRGWRVFLRVLDALDTPPLPLPIEETPPTPHRPIVTYCPWCVRPYQLADPRFVPRGIPQVCHIHGTGSLRMMTREQARRVMEQQRETLGADGPFELDELKPWPRGAHFVNGAN